jgi:alkaline phosphatase D
VNEAGTHYAIKKQSRDLFHQFWRTPASSARMTHTSIYNVHRFRNGNHSLNLVLLDLRYFRDEAVPCPNSADTFENYCPVSGSHIMEEEQWTFLHNVLDENANITIIGSSTQLAREYDRCESWTLYPEDMRRFFDVTRNRTNIFVISGDIHWAEISHNEHVWDVTASGLTHFSADVRPNKFRVGNAYAGLHFGELVINWRTLTVVASIVGVDGKVQITQALV